MIRRIYTIAINTFREALRDRVLLGILVFSALLLLFTLALAELSLNEGARVIRDTGLTVISLMSVLTAVVLGASLLYKEIERKTLYLILPKPISRTEFLLGKYLGICLTGLVFIACTGALLCVLSAFHQGLNPLLILGALLIAFGVLALAGWMMKELTIALLPWSLLTVALGATLAIVAQVEVVTLFAALILFAAEFAVVTAVAMFFSAFSTPFLTGLLTLGIWLLGRSADTMVSIKSRTLGPALKQLLKVLARFIPNFNLFVPGQYALSGASRHWAGLFKYMSASLGYAALCVALLLALASYIFTRRDFT